MAAFWLCGLLPLLASRALAQDPAPAVSATGFSVAPAPAPATPPATTLVASGFSIASAPAPTTLPATTEVVVTSAVPATAAPTTSAAPATAAPTTSTAEPAESTTTTTSSAAAVSVALATTSTPIVLHGSLAFPAQGISKEVAEVATKTFLSDILGVADSQWVEVVASEGAATGRRLRSNGQVWNVAFAISVPTDEDKKRIEDDMVGMNDEAGISGPFKEALRRALVAAGVASPDLSYVSFTGPGGTSVTGMFTTSLALSAGATTTTTVSMTPLLESLESSTTGMTAAPEATTSTPLETAQSTSVSMTPLLESLESSTTGMTAAPEATTSTPLQTAQSTSAPGALAPASVRTGPAETFAAPDFPDVATSTFLPAAPAAASVELPVAPAAASAGDAAFFAPAPTAAPAAPPAAPQADVGDLFAPAPTAAPAAPPAAPQAFLAQSEQRDQPRATGHLESTESKVMLAVAVFAGLLVIFTMFMMLFPNLFAVMCGLAAPEPVRASDFDREIMMAPPGMASSSQMLMAPDSTAYRPLMLESRFD
eukprot:TRINITY_DN3414_c0_g1_i1.p1 TRINITY_DN3414_c0_g1~~TRINITY_DN3414_c0_g1_i1.p1  ORF type:complete len:540 (-),score=129.89 TRINITY_DN3414_c0_g1_i1:119-1738(-)